jgi:hypothetical protein
MRMVAVMMALRTDGKAHPLTDALVCDLFWGLATPADRLEHVHVHVGARVIDVVLFLQAADNRMARQRTLTFCQRVTSRSPIMADWYVVSIESWQPASLEYDAKINLRRTKHD